MRKTSSVGFGTPLLGAPTQHQAEEDIEWKWASGIGQNGRIYVSPPSEDLPWTKGPQVAEVSPGLYIGNLSAASQPQDFHALLNCSSESEVYPPSNILYHKIPLADGANNVISEQHIREAVAWLEQRLDQNAKTLVFCRAGLGRSGSVLISYVYYAHPNWTFQQALEHIWRVKSDVYPHKDLQHTLEKVFPRAAAPMPLLHRGNSVSSFST